MIGKNLVVNWKMLLGSVLCVLTGSMSLYAQGSYHIMDMVHHNPGEPLTQSVFNDPKYLKDQGYNGQVFNDFIFPSAAITFDNFDSDIFPQGSESREWVNQAAIRIKSNIKKAHEAGLKAYYFMDIIVLPKTLVEKYRDDIVDEEGRISFERPKTREIHRVLLEEIFETFPGLDGLVIRTGETYVHNVPYHTGNNPITTGEKSHVQLLNILREEVCVKQNKKIFYRTWSFGGMHENLDYYLAVTNKIEPHTNLTFSIKHTQGDYQRTFDFNPTIGKGKHSQIVEVQCQREYEGKGAYPNYIAKGVIEGFEEYHTAGYQEDTTKSDVIGLKGLKDNPVFKGVWTWSRGGGWVGPYIENEFWCKVNAYVVSKWCQGDQDEEEVFDQFMDEVGIEGSSKESFRKLCLLTEPAIIRGHASMEVPFKNYWAFWLRDQFLPGINPNKDKRRHSSEGLLYSMFTTWDELGVLDEAVNERFESVELWKRIVDLSQEVEMNNKVDERYLEVSSNYGLILHQIIAEGWRIMALGFEGDKTGTYEVSKIKKSIKKYDGYWLDFENLHRQYEQCATLYKPYAFEYVAPDYHGEMGMKASVNQYRKLVNTKHE